MHTTQHWGRERYRRQSILITLAFMLLSSAVAPAARASDAAVINRVRAEARTDGGTARAEISIITTEGGSVTETYSVRREGASSAVVRYSAPQNVPRKAISAQARAAAAASLLGDGEEGSAPSVRLEAQAAAGHGARAVPGTARAETSEGASRARAGNASAAASATEADAPDAEGEISAAQGDRETSAPVRSADDPARRASLVRTIISIIHSRFNSFISYALSIF